MRVGKPFRALPLRVFHDLYDLSAQQLEKAGNWYPTLAITSSVQPQQAGLLKAAGFKKYFLIRNPNSGNMITLWGRGFSPTHHNPVDTVGFSFTHGGYKGCKNFPSCCGAGFYSPLACSYPLRQPISVCLGQGGTLIGWMKHTGNGKWVRVGVKGGR